MGLYHYRCMLTGISLRASHAVLVMLEPTENGPVPCSLPLKGCYDCAGAIDGIKPDANSRRLLKFFTSKIEAGEMIGNEDYLDDYLPFSNIEDVLQCLERNITDGAETIMCRGEPLKYALICQEIWDAIVTSVPPSTEKPATLFPRLFQGSTLAPEIYGKKLADVKFQLYELSAITEFMARRGIAWRPLQQNDAGQHFEEMGQFLNAARDTFSDSEMMLEALRIYEQNVREGLHPNAEAYLGPVSGSSSSPNDIHGIDDELADSDRSDDDASSDSELQEYVFFLGDRNLGSFFISEDGPVQPEVIHRRLVTAPTKMSLGEHLSLLWVEETEDGAETMIWTADTASEAREAQRFYDAAHGLDVSDDELAEDFQPTVRTAEETRLLQAIRDDFGNDTPLLAYADWLTTQEKPQGEFIRVCLEIDKTTADDPRFVALNQRWSDLLEEHGETWYQPLSALNLFPYERSFWMERGVICEVEINRPTLLTRRAADLFDAVPLLRVLTFDCEPFDVSELAEIPQMSQIVSLELNHLEVIPEQLSTLLNSPYLQNVTDLNLTGNDAGTDLVRAVIESPLWPRLQSLRLSNCDIFDEGIEQLASGDATLALRCLVLDGNDLSKSGFTALGRAVGLTQLKTLSLGNLKLTAADAAAMSKAAWIPQLESLSLNSSKLTTAVCTKLFAWPVRNLQKLDLASCQLQDGDITLLLRSPPFVHLTELDLSSNNLSDQGIAALVQSPNASQLRVLDLSSNPIGSEGLLAIANSPWLAELRELKLFGIMLGTSGVQALACSTGLPKITSLFIDDENELTDLEQGQLIDRFGESTVPF